MLISIFVMYVYAAGLCATGITLRTLWSSATRPRPLFVVGSLGAALSLLVAFYSGILNAKILRLQPAEWLFTTITVSTMVLAIPAAVGFVIAVIRRGRNVLYRRAFVLALVF